VKDYSVTQKERHSDVTQSEVHHVIAFAKLSRKRKEAMQMPLQLRQICLVAESLAPVIDDLTAVLGIHPCYVDPGVGAFGLENTLMPIGRNFLEVVSPIQPDTAAGRYLKRRGGDGGYMVITQADSKATQLVARQRAQDLGVRIAHETLRKDWHLIQFHPGDLEAAFLEIETDAFNDFTGSWMPVGGLGWETFVDQRRTIDLIEVQLQCEDPASLAAKWGSIIGALPTPENDHRLVPLNNAALRFIPIQDTRGPGLSGLTVSVTDRAAVIDTARSRGLEVSGHDIHMAGVRWHLKETQAST